ncbi:MAG: LamG domain-containing protein, partial [Verrucomicrobia bacterium]|nr:LamG domain-containing protein [Verrucomicrobiota bacterium]
MRPPTSHDCVSLLGKLFTLLVVLLLPGLAFAQPRPSYTWTGAGGNGLWSNAANWSPGGVPLGDAKATINGGAVDASSLADSGIAEIVLNGGSLTMNGLQVDSFTQNGGTVSGSNVVRAAFNWNAGNWNSAGTLVVRSNAVLTLSTGADHDMPNHALLNYGTVILAGGRIRGGSSRIENLGLWDFQSDTGINSDYGGNGVAYVNRGTLRKSKGTGESYFLMPIQNYGTVDAAVGRLDFLAGIQAFDGSRFIGAGENSLLGGSLDFSGQIVTSNLVQRGGVLVGVHTFVGSYDWIGGNWNSSSTTTLARNSALRMLGGADHDMAGHTVINQGAVAWSQGRIRGGGGGTTITNEGLWDIQGDLVINSDYGGNGVTVHNLGTLRKSFGIGNSVISGVLNNRGAIEVLVGVLNLNAGGVGNGNFYSDAGATLAINGGYTFQDGSLFPGAGALVVGGGLCVFDGAFQIADWHQVGGALGGSHRFTGHLTWSSGTWNSVGDTTLAPTTTLVIDSGAEHDMASHTLTNKGTVVWKQGRIRGGGGGTLIVNKGLWDIQADSALNADYGGNGVLFQNIGVLRKSTGPGDTYFSVPLQSPGILDIQVGSLSIVAGILMTDGSQSTGAGTVYLAAGAHDLRGGILVSNVVQTGGVLVGNHVLQGAYTWSGGNWNSDYDTTIGDQCVLRISSGAEHDLASHTLENKGRVIWSGGRIRGGGGGSAIYNRGLWEAISASGFNQDYGGNGMVFYNSGTFRSSAPGGSTYFSMPIVHSGVIEVLTGAVAVNVGATFQEGGVIRGPGAVQLVGGTISMGGAVTVDGGVFQLLGGVLAAGTSGALQGINNGLLEWQTGWISGSLALGEGMLTRWTTGQNKQLADFAALHNRGHVSWEDGPVFAYSVSGAATIENHASGVFTIASRTCQLTRNGASFENLFLNEGLLQLGTPSGLTTVNGWRFQQAPPGVMQLALADVDAVTGFGHYTSSSPIALGGALQATLANSFTPSPGQSFSFLSGSALTGGFTQLQLPPVADGLAWSLDDYQSTLTLRLSASHSCASPVPDLFAWFNGEDTTTDLVGRRVGRISGGVGYGLGKVGRAFHLDRSTGSIDIGLLPELQGAKEFTVMAWVRRYNAGASIAGIVGKWDVSPCTRDNSFLLYMGEGAASGNGAFSVDFSNNNCASAGGVNSIPAGEWVHVAGVWRSSDGFIGFYKNGVLESSAQGGLGATMKWHSAYPARIGEWGVLRDSQYKFPGDIDEVMLFSRALSAGEIAGIVGAGEAGICRSNAPCLPPTPSLAAWWPGDGNPSDGAGVNAGSLSGGAGFDAGYVGQAFRFDGVDDAVTIQDDVRLRPASLSFSAWIMAEDTQRPPQPIFGKATGTGNAMSYSLRLETGGQIRL